MEKSLRILGLAAIVGAVAIVAAQQRVAQSRRGNGVTPAVASPGRQNISPNQVTEAMIGYFCSKQNYEIERANLAGRNDIVPKVIRANCAAMLTVMTPDQRKATIAEWQLEKYAPGDPTWVAVTKAPILVDRLLHVGPKAIAAADKATEEVWAPVRKYTDDLTERLLQTPEWKAAKTEGERNRVHYAFFQKYGTQTPLIDRKRAALERHTKALADIRAALTSSEQEEFERIVDRFEASIRAVALPNGGTP